MRRVVLIGLICVVGAGAPAVVRAQAAARKAAAALDCRACHTAEVPTKRNPALAACPRLLVKAYHSVGDAPQRMTLGDTTGSYGPVTFPHREHARMAETGKGCNGCHHYDQARSIQQCKACHATSRLRADLGKPDVQAAMHRQCLECHREWSPASKCGTCHTQQGGIAARGAASGAASGAANATERLPRPAAPARIVYETKAAAGKIVTFRHDEHTQRFALQCADCHQQQVCTSCHGANEMARGRATATRSLTTKGADGVAARAAAGATAHARCSACHATTTAGRCTTCHTDKAARSTGFDHRVRTGWSLNRFHAPLACQRCHTTPGKYTTLDTACESCHKGWPTKFDHTKTGLALDDLHTDADCVSCHEDKAFVKPPSCGGCHTDKSYPADKPGKAVAKPVPRK